MAKYRARRSGEDMVYLPGDEDGEDWWVSLASRKTIAVSYSPRGPELSLIKWHSSTVGRGNHSVSTSSRRTPSDFGFPCLLQICRDN